MESTDLTDGILDTQKAQKASFLQSSLQFYMQVDTGELLRRFQELPVELKIKILALVFSRPLAYDTANIQFSMACPHGAAFLASKYLRPAAILTLLGTAYPVQIGKIDVEGATCKMLSMFEPKLITKLSIADMSNLTHIHFTFRRPGVKIVDEELLREYSLRDPRVVNRQLLEQSQDSLHEQNTMELKEEEFNDIYNIVVGFNDASSQRRTPYQSVIVSGVAWRRQFPNPASTRIIRLLNEINSISTTFPITTRRCRYLNPIYPWESYSRRLEKLHGINQDAMDHYLNPTLAGHRDFQWRYEKVDWWPRSSIDKTVPYDHTPALLNPIAKIAVRHTESHDVADTEGGILLSNPPRHMRASSIQLIQWDLDSPADDYTLLSLLRIPQDAPTCFTGEYEV